MLIPQKAYCPVRVKWAIWLNSHHNVELFPHYRVVSHSAWLHSACILFESSHSLHSISASWVWSPRHVETYTRVWEIWSPTVSVCSWGMRFVFVLQIIFLLEFSKSLKSHQIRSAQSNNLSSFFGKTGRTFLSYFMRSPHVYTDFIDV